MPYNVKPIESLTASPWYEVVDTDNQFRLWIVEHDLLTDTMTCTCEAETCEHQAIAAAEALAADWRENQADRLDYARGQF